VTPRFLSVDNVVELHRRTIEREGGAAGIRDSGLLESAVTAPRQTFGGEYLHPDVSSMAAAYLYHLVKNHPFVDGNKRAGALSFMFFLKKNAPEKIPGPKDLERVTLAVAESSMSKEELVQWFRLLGKASD
jgi:death on curing protein